MKKAKSGREMIGLLGVAAQTTEEEFVKVLKKLSFDGFRDLVDLTPVKTGRARSGWQVSLNGAPESSPFNTFTAGGVISAPAYSVPKIKFGDTVHLYNNVNYIIFLERGHSKQARTGMIEPTKYRMQIQMWQLMEALSKKKLDI